MIFHDKGFENLVVWDPFPLLALFRLRVSRDQLLQLGDCVGDVQQLNLGPLPIAFDAPLDPVVVYSAPAVDIADENSETSSVADLREEHLNNALVGTVLEGLSMDLDWPGGINSEGAFSTNVESDLMDKMQFVNSHASPFSGLKRLKNLRKTESCPLLYLLLAAETSVHSNQEAEIHLRQFIDKVRSSSATDKIHPWAMVVAARVGPNHARRLLCTFAALFPTQKRILSPIELELVRGEKSSQSEETLEWPELLQEQWEQLQMDYPLETKSDAMAELLRLTGLRKVKEEALSLWNSALQLRKMDPEARKKNLLTANYCFLGNPGSGASFECSCRAQKQLDLTFLLSYFNISSRCLYNRQDLRGASFRFYSMRLWYQREECNRRDDCSRSKRWRDR